jgi:L-arabinokinase
MIVYYISAHGFGHAVRACEVIRRLPADLPLTIRTEAPEWLLRSELGARPFDPQPACFDCGTLGPDSTAVDLAMTIDAAEPLLDANDTRLAGEVAMLCRLGARVVVADAPAFPLRAAAEAGIPSILVANFTWSAIYRRLLEQTHPDAALADRATRVIDRIQADYDRGGTLLVPALDIPLQACRRRMDIPLIARRGIPRRAELAAAAGLDAARPIFLLYLGVGGRRGMQWDRLASLADSNGNPLQLVAYDVPSGLALSVRAIPEAFGHADAIASVDAAIAKPGYSIVAECLAAGTPIFYPPRPQFAEADVIHRALRDWGGGLCIAEADFLALDWQSSLARLSELKAAARPVDGSGGTVVATLIENHWRSESPPVVR